MMITPIFTRKENLEILWLKINIPRTEPIIPPARVIVRSVNSEILCWCFTAFLLSNPKTIKLKKLMMIRKYIMTQI